jgi:hypothetical protein
MEVSSDMGQAADCEQCLNKLKPIRKLYTKILRSLFGKKAMNFTFLTHDVVHKCIKLTAYKLQSVH